MEIPEGPPELVLMFPCACGSREPLFYPADQLGRLVRCPHFGSEMYVIGSEFGAFEWETTYNFSQLEACAEMLRVSMSPRQRRLAACHWSRTQLALASNDWTGAAIAEGETWADTGRKPHGVGVLLRQRRRARHGDFYAVVCIDVQPRLPVVDRYSYRTDPAIDAYRDVFPNPFVPLDWNPEWFTSTVRGLAAHMYESRDFSAMPVLGDALQDAGCDHELVLGHCRSTKPHARGCWVVDAILGKT
jgi:hypothetical protein